MSGLSGVSFDDSGICKILSSYDVNVPPYQRDYSWKKEYVTQYLEDIAYAISQGESLYFLGTVVFIRKENNDREVVDGQQRLATTTLLLSAMKHLSHPDDEIVFRIDRIILSDKSGAIGDSKVNLNSSDSAVFSSLVKTGSVGDAYIPNRESHERLKTAYDECLIQLKKVVAPTPTKQHEIFTTWFEFLQFNAGVISITVDDEVNAYRMFETLNDRGLKVSQADLIKNFLFSLSGDKIETAKSLWSSMKGALESISGEDVDISFIRYSLMATDDFIQGKNMYKKLKDKIKTKNQSIDMLSKLEKLAQTYVAIFNPSSSFWKGKPPVIGKHIQVINIFNLTALKPLLLSSAEKLAPDETEKLFKSAMSMSVRLILASRTSTTSAAVEKPISEAAIKVYNGDFVKCDDITDYLRAVIPNDSLFTEEFATASSSKSLLSRYYLRSMETAHEDNTSVNPSHIINDDATSVNLEHILPKSMQDNWGSFSTEEHSIYRNRIGNLALLTLDENDLAGNDNFIEKSKVYKKSAFLTSRMIADFEEWTPKEIAIRQKTLCALAIKAWPF